MTEAPLALYRRVLPELFAAALQRLERKASNGDESVRRRLDAAQLEPVGSLLRLTGEGGGELHLLAGRRELRVEPQAERAGFGYALSLPAAAAADALALVERDPDEVDLAVLGMAALGSDIARKLFTEVAFSFELAIEGVPDLGLLRLQLSLGRATLAPKPEFKLCVSYDDLDDARAEGLAPHQLFLAGKMRIEGDVAKALLLGMTLAQLE
jgi:hypothetical protein